MKVPSHEGAGVVFEVFVVPGEEATQEVELIFGHGFEDVLRVVRVIEERAALARAGELREPRKVSSIGCLCHAGV